MAATLEDGVLRTHPVFCLMRTELTESLVRFTHGGQRKIDKWTAQHRCVEVRFDDVAGRSPTPIPSTICYRLQRACRCRGARPQSLREIASCIGGYDPASLPVAAAQQFIARLVAPVEAVEQLALRSALGRVLAHDVVSAIAVPAHDNSAMDGYALRGADLTTGAESRLPVVGSGFAGSVVRRPGGRGQCVRIMTGAPMPAGLDTVVPQEFVRCDGDLVVLPAGIVRRRRQPPPRGRGPRHRRGRARGGPPAASGRPRPAGVARPRRGGGRRRLRVAFFSTGDELRSVGEPLDAGCVYDSNRYTLWAMLQRLGVEVIDLGVVRDRAERAGRGLPHRRRVADAVITSGGVSVGEADHTKQVMAELGDVLFWRVAMRPGRPLAIGRIDSAGRSAVLFGLPGNPVAVMITFYALVRDALLAMSGAAAQTLPLLRAASVGAVPQEAGANRVPARHRRTGTDGGWQVRTTGAQGSGILRSMSEANGLIVLHHSQGHVAAGELVDVLPFDGLV